jgi:predicted ATP-dependent endonuclease of OLD family
MSIKINELQVENVKRVKAVKLEPSATGLTVIGGKNGQGKTSVLDAIAWALGGNKKRPSNAKREGSLVPPTINITMDNGLQVIRKGKNGDLTVIDPTGKKAGQSLLDDFISGMALDLPKFMNANNKEKADTLLQIIGLGPQLAKMEQEYTSAYNTRKAIGQIATQKEKHAEDMLAYPDAPAELVSAGELIKQQQTVMATNSENQRKRENKAMYEREMAQIQVQIDELTNKLAKATENLTMAQKAAEDLHDESTEALENNIHEVEAINNKVRTNMEREKAQDEANNYKQQYGTLSEQLQKIKEDKVALLQQANLPLDGLSVEDGELVYNSAKWDCMSGADQLKVAVAIARKLNPNCGFVLLDKLEQMDRETMQEFGTWLEVEGLQVIATRVSTGEECSIVIEDGYVRGEYVEPVQVVPTFKEGEF